MCWSLDFFRCIPFTSKVVQLVVTMWGSGISKRLKLKFSIVIVG